MNEFTKPLASPALATQLAKKLFGLTEVLEVKEFKSFIDRNFYIQGFIPTTTDYTERGEFVLKILNSFQSRDGGIVDAENEIINHMRNEGFPCPEIVPASNGDLKVLVELPIAEEDGKTEVCVVRMLTVVPGIELNEIEPNKHLLFKLGQFTGNVSKVLKDFSHPAMKTRELISIDHFPSLPRLLEDIVDAEIKSLVTEVWSDYNKNALPHLPAFRTGTVNNDIHGENILVTKSSSDISGYEITGFIDFGDVTLSIILIEVVCPMIFFMDRGFEVSGHILAGYQSSFPLPRLEYDCLYYVLAARLCQNVVLSTISAEKMQDSYVGEVGGKYFEILKKFWSCPKQEMERIWRACEQE